MPLIGAVLFEANDKWQTAPQQRHSTLGCIVGMRVELFVEMKPWRSGDC
jgi:hypothetical protein